jgi:hypothetical protein
MQFGELVHRFGPQVQDRQLYLTSAFPDIAESGWDVDLGQGLLRFRDSGRECPIEVIGSEAEGTWMWGWALEDFPEELVGGVSTIRDWGEQKEIEALAAAGFSLPVWKPGQLLSAMSCTAVVAGLLDVPAIFACHDKRADRRLWVALTDEELRQPAPEDPCAHVALRFPQILALSGIHPHEGGLTLSSWVLALDGFCRSHGVNGKMDGEAVVLEHGGRTARAEMANGSVTISLER